MIDKKCLMCDFYDPDYECTCSPLDKWYACPLEPEPKPEDFMTQEEIDNASNEMLQVRKAL